ncbi:MAG: hypothetical protein C0483_22315 [Pirellula sp.]|nr:hypothetical protein [Pirellula sp.]
MARVSNDELRVNDELLWTAYQYSVGELSDEAARLFEEQLSIDPVACDALAEAVKLGETVRAAIDLQPVASATAASAGRSATATWIMVATAACVALVVGWQTFRTAGEQGPQEVAEAQAESDSRLLAALGPEHSWDAPSSLVDALTTEDEVETEDHDLAVQTADDMDMTAPDWLLAAVVESTSAANE